MRCLESQRGLRQLLVLLLLVLVACLAGGAAADPQPASLRLQQIRAAAYSFDPAFDYAAESTNCSDISMQVHRLASALEWQRARPSDVRVPDPERHVRAIVAGALPRWGVDGERETCHPKCRGRDCNQPGGPIFGDIGRELAHMLYRHGARWSDETKNAIVEWVDRKTPWGSGVHHTLYNQYFGFVTERLLTGEALCHAPSWQSGVRDLESVFENYVKRGGWETQSPTYSIYDIGYLAMLTGLRDEVARRKATALLEFELLAGAHLYLPEGGLGTPHTRDNPDFGGLWDGKRRDRSLGALYALVSGDSDFHDPSGGGWPGRAFLAIGMTLNNDYRMPPVIRSIFLDKGKGYRFEMLHGIVAHEPSTPASRNRLGENRMPAYLWRVDVLPGGRALRSVAYATWSPGFTQAPSIYVYAPEFERRYAIFHHYQPQGANDTDDRGEPFLTRKPGRDPDSAEAQGYDREHMTHHWSTLNLFDPMSRPSRFSGRLDGSEKVSDKRPKAHCGEGNQACRAYEDTRMFLPNLDHPAIGGRRTTRRSKTLPGAIWHIGQVGDVYVAVLPLGRILAEELRDWRTTSGEPLPQYHTYIRLRGRSGSVMELATTDDFDDIEAYAGDLEDRHVRFQPNDPRAGGYPSAEFDARDANGSTRRMRLEYWPDHPQRPGRERRYLAPASSDALELIEDAVYFGAGEHGVPPMRSPFVDWDRRTNRMVVQRGGYDSHVIDWGELRSSSPSSVPPGCSGAEPALDASWVGLEPNPDQGGDRSESRRFRIRNAGFRGSRLLVSMSVEYAERSCSGWVDIDPLPTRAIPAGASVDVRVGRKDSERCEGQTRRAELVVRSEQGWPRELRFALPAADR